MQKDCLKVGWLEYEVAEYASFCEGHKA